MPVIWFHFGPDQGIVLVVSEAVIVTRCWLACVACVLLVTVICGCPSGERGPIVPPKERQNATDKNNNQGSDRSPEEGPVLAVNQVITGLSQKKLTAVWDFLPASYQADLQGLVRLFGSRMDADLWNRVVGVIRRTAKILRDKSDWLQTPAKNTPSQPGQKVAPSATPVDYPALATLLESIANSEFGDLDQLKTIELGAWCAKSGGPLLDQLQEFARRMPADPMAKTLTELQGLKVKQVQRSAITAVIEISTKHGEKAEIPYMLIENKWIPADLANGWIESIGQARARLAVTLDSENMAAAKPQYLLALDVIDELLGRLEKAPSKDEFDFVWTQGVQNILSVAMSMSAGSAEAVGNVDSESDSNPGPIVSIRISVPSQFDDPDMLLEKIAKLTDDGKGRFREYSATKREVVIRVGPVEDVAQFAEKLKLIKVTKVDAEGRQIFATWEEKSSKSQ